MERSPRKTATDFEGDAEINILHSDERTANSVVIAVVSRMKPWLHSSWLLPIIPRWPQGHKALVKHNMQHATMTLDMVPASSMPQSHKATRAHQNVSYADGTDWGGSLKNNPYQCHRLL